MLRRTRTEVPIGVRALLVTALALSTPLIAGAAASPAHPLVPSGGYLVADKSRHLLVLDRRGKLLGRVPRFASPVQALEIAPDRRHAYVSVYVNERAPRLYDVALRTGRRTRLGNATSPSLSRDRQRLAYVAVERPEDITYRTALVIRTFATGRTRSIPLPARTPLGTPPELIINWSPDGHQVAVFDGTVVRVVDVATAKTVASQPELPGRTGLSPVFVDGHTLVVLANCCIGRQRLVAVDLHSGVRAPFAELRAPVESVRRLRGGDLLVVTALHRMTRVSPGHQFLVATGVVAGA